MYFLRKGASYFSESRQGPNKAVPKPDEASVFNSEEEAIEIMNKYGYKGWKAVFVDGTTGDGKAGASPSQKCGKSPKAIKAVPYMDAGKELDDMVDAMKAMLDDALAKKEAYVQRLSEVDKLLVDLDHFVEFSELDGVSGYKAYYVMRELFRERRNIKSCLEKLNVLSQASESMDKLNGSVHKAGNLYRKAYEPRACGALFVDDRAIDMFYEEIRNNGAHCLLDDMEQEKNG